MNKKTDNYRVGDKDIPSRLQNLIAARQAYRLNAGLPSEQIVPVDTRGRPQKIYRRGSAVPSLGTPAEPEKPARQDGPAKTVDGAGTADAE